MTLIEAPTIIPAGYRNSPEEVEKKDLALLATEPEGMSVIVLTSPEVAMLKVRPPKAPCVNVNPVS